MHNSLPQASFLIDTGATVSLMSKSCYEKIPEDQRPVIKPAACPLKAANNTKFVQYGCITLRFEIQGMRFRHKFWVVESKNCGLLGSDFLQKERAEINLGRGKITHRGIEIKAHNNNRNPFHRKVVTKKL